VPPPNTNVPTLDAAAFDCMTRFDDSRRTVMTAHVYAMSRAPGSRDFDYQTRASAYIWVAAALEEYVKRFLEGLIDEINRAEIPRGGLRPSLLALDNAGSFQALNQQHHQRDLKKWEYQIAILESVDSPKNSHLSLVEEHWPMDGSTLHRGHLEAIWHVFGLEPEIVPSGRMYGFLTDLAENRTRAAHGEESAVRLGRQQSYQDVIDLINQAEDLVSHLLDRGTSYLLQTEYLR
jgi:hypothetical protein